MTGSISPVGWIRKIQTSHVTWLTTNAPATIATAPQVPRPAETIIKTVLPTPSENGVARLRSAPGNRRTQSRHACRLGADVFRMGVPVPNRCSVSDISSGGCYVEMPTPFPAGTQVEIVVRTQTLKLRVQGVVQPGKPTGPHIPQAQAAPTSRASPFHSYPVSV